MRKIAVFTGTRAEYGLLYWIMREIQESISLELQLYVGGMHLSQEFGYTIDQIRLDGFSITEELNFLLSSDTPVGVAKSMALATINASEVLERHKPDVLVVLGDRFEALAVAQAAMLSRIPIAHIHGGETTEGLIDEAVRHSLTKMAHLHFAATETYRKRIIQLGEQPRRVFNVGAPGIDNIVKMNLLDVDDLSSSLDFDLTKDYFMVTYHPVTLADDGESQALANLLECLTLFPDYKCVISYPNADPNGRRIISMLERFRDENSDRVYLARSLGQLRYLSLLKGCSAVIGNSSSGLIEAPTFNVPTVDIGERQAGRIAGKTVIKCEEDRESISTAIKLALSKEFIEECKLQSNPYGGGGSSSSIVHVLANENLDGILQKKFYDLGNDA
ncbi:MULTISPECIES: UDP-N-acetylglucosamine 2-epimerase [Gammaproteobacteria]|uniref:UDP-N-acetylglucosamine 2-epimerase n=1 Tax=Gammaproteobacteria TaxID=1236 RepID=UPI000DD0EBC3|nr:MULTISPECIES: UDP-N-acetylglucosamine 2-epimerase [Gammaproteobacteria]RTE86069.1 UDP-N-acetylglucosamine 2-epimerase (hydrolyzing) [Aliidiomarina sp. B3213]TCZ91423.1 UDP-N-acetylglucosamine 2-epimerase (hydrolyzing) [Lysobacter sp. N42]